MFSFMAFLTFHRVMPAPPEGRGVHIQERSESAEKRRQARGGLTGTSSGGGAESGGRLYLEYLATPGLLSQAGRRLGGAAPIPAPLAFPLSTSLHRGISERNRCHPPRRGIVLDVPAEDLTPIHGLDTPQPR